MSLNIEQIEQQIAGLQKSLDELKNQKLLISRHFTGQYFSPYQGKQYRRMESNGVEIWEFYIESKKDWVILDTRESQKLEKMYHTDCVILSREPEVSGEPEVIEVPKVIPNKKKE
jgi:hypothetical protein